MIVETVIAVFLVLAIHRNYSYVSQLISVYYYFFMSFCFFLRLIMSIRSFFRLFLKSTVENKNVCRVGTLAVFGFSTIVNNQPN